MKKFAVWLLAATFSLSVLGLAISTAANSVFSTPEPLKESLQENNVYGSAADSIVDEVVKSTKRQVTEKQPSEDFQLDAKTTKTVARKVITPDRLQEYAEEIINGTYNWLEGEVEQPDFEINTGAMKKDLANAAGDTAVAQIKKKPECTLSQLYNLDINNIDPFDLPCQPPGINLQAERAKIVKEVAASDELFPDEKFTAADLKGEDAKQTPFENLAFLPPLFQWSQRLPFILGVLAIASASGVVYLKETKRKGIKKIAVILLVSGVLLLIAIVVANFLFGQARFDQQSDQAQLQESAVAAVRSLNAAFNRVLLIFAIIYAATGFGGLLGLHYTKPKVTTEQNPKLNKK